MPKALGPRTKRWGLPAIGLAAVTCVGVCALPILAAGSILGGGLALICDSCFAPLATLLFVVGAAALVLWVRRARKRDKCGDCGNCGCTPDSEPDMVQPNMFRSGP
jgi:mercuric ion transport protein